MNRAAVAISGRKASDGAKSLPDRRLSLLSFGWFNARVALICGLLIAATLAVYVQVRGFDFVLLDDGLYVGENEHVRNGVSLANLGWAFRTWRDGNWFPLTWISLMCDASAYGMWAGGYHLTNLVLHAANVLLVFATFAKMTRSVLPSAFVAALFAIHPQHVESVAWIAERKDVLSMFFGLCALYAYVSYARSGRARGLALSVIFYLCSLCSKQTFVTLPFVLLLLDYWPLQRLACGQLSLFRDQSRAGDLAVAGDDNCVAQPSGIRRLASLLIEKIPFFILTAAFCAVAVVAQSKNGAMLSLEAVPLGARLLNAVVVYRLYLQHAAFPLALVAFYPHPGSGLGMGDVAISAVFLLGVTVWAGLNVRRRPYLLVGWLWFLGTLVPMIGLVQLSGQQMADRYTYLPLLGCYLAIAWLAASLATQWSVRPAVVASIASLVLVAYGSAAFVQAGYWHDSVRLFRHEVAVGKENPYSLTRLGRAYVKEQRFDEAHEPLERAVELCPDLSEAQFLLGSVLQKKSKFDEAAPHFRAAVVLDDDNAAAHLNLGTVLLARRELPEARREFDRVVELDKDNPRAQVYLAELCWRLHQYDESIAHAKRGLELDSTQKQCRRLMVIALRDQGRLDEAIAQLRLLVAADPNDQGSQRELARLLASRRDVPRADSR
jgi:tetratricopeptide (TPR) repeat protein